MKKLLLFVALGGLFFVGQGCLWVGPHHHIHRW